MSTVIADGGVALTDVERKVLGGWERIIQNGLRSFREVGTALMVIRDDRLYRETHADFQSYCVDKWSFKKSYAYYLINAAKTVDAIAENSTRVDTPLPETEKQVRPLAKLHDPQDKADAWDEAVRTAPDGKVTPRHLEDVVSKWGNEVTDHDTEDRAEPLSGNFMSRIKAFVAGLVNEAQPHEVEAIAIFLEEAAKDVRENGMRTVDVEVRQCELES